MLGALVVIIPSQSTVSGCHLETGKESTSMGTQLSHNYVGNNKIKSVDVIKYYLDNEFKQFDLSLNIPNTISYIVDQYYSFDKFDDELHGDDIHFITDSRIKCVASHTQSALIKAVFTKQEFVTISFGFIVHSHSYYSCMLNSTSIKT